jgi:hypothetical protein
MGYSQTPQRRGDPMRLITRKELRTLHIATRHHHTINSGLAILRYAEEYDFKARFGDSEWTARPSGPGSADGRPADPPGWYHAIYSNAAGRCPRRRCVSLSGPVAISSLGRCRRGLGRIGCITFEWPPRPSAEFAETSAIPQSDDLSHGVHVTRSSSVKNTRATVCRSM